MFIPFISQRSTTARQSESQQARRRSDVLSLIPRLGGGGGGKGSGGGGGKGSGGGGGGGKGGGGGSSSGSKGGSSGSSSGSEGGSSSSGSSSKGGSSSSSSKGSGSTINTNSGKGSRPASSSSKGGGPVVIIPNGYPFAGRSAGGATRGQIYGTRGYGSGYPNVIGRGTYGRGFPYYYWPVVWWVGPGYLRPDEYGSPDNTTRPGGSLATATFPSNSQNTTLRILSDNSTVTILIDQITGSCGSFIQDPQSIITTPYNASSLLPRPEQVIQYYRASSIALSLDGYNNTAALSSNDSTPDDPLPSGVNTDYINCVNNTIGTNAPLIDSSAVALAWSAPSAPGLVGVAWLIYMLLALV